MPDTTPDRRKAPRYSLILAAEVTDLSSGAKLAARTSDLSRTGCYVDTLNPVPAGSLIRVHLSQGSEVFEVTGKVIYTSTGLGMGIAFQDQIPPGQLAILDHWLQEAARQPA